MPRYLTPSKIGLLTLISVYVEGHVSATATVPVLSFLITNLLPPRYNIKSEISKTSLSIQDFQNALSKLTSDFPGRTIWDLFLRRLWQFDSLDSLHVFFEVLPNLLAKTRDQLIQDRDNGHTQSNQGIRLSRTSPLGLFLRRAQVEFVRMQMEDGVRLWKSLLLFREPSRVIVRKRNPSVSKTGFDINIPLDGPVHDALYGNLIQSPTSITCAHDMEMLLDFQLEKIQKAGERLPPAMRDQLHQMAKVAVDLPVRICYMEFLDAWRGGDYPSAYDNLHRYFDYTMQSRDKTFYQYALLNLAILHADFGCWPEAISAINETISTAREHKDLPCLNYALSWLFHFGKANPEEIEHVRKTGVLGTDKEGLTFLKAKARESGMWGLLATCYLTEARQLQLGGESLSSAFECIAKASHLNLVKDIPSNKGSEFNVQSSLFSRLGQKHSAWSSNEVFLTCYSGSSQSEDLLHFTCRSALMEAAQGHHTEAFSKLETLPPSITRIVKYQQFWIACNLLIKLRQSINKTDFIAAEHFLTQLKANVPPHHDISFSITVNSIELEMRRGQLDTAMELVEKELIRLEPGQEDMYQTIKLMLLKAQIFAKAGLPQKGFSLSIRAAALAHRARYLNVLWEAIGVLSKVLCSLSEFDAAIQLLKSIMPRVLETDDGEMIANSHSYLADAYMGLAGNEGKDGSSKRKEQMNKVLECLDRAFDEYSRLDHVTGQCEMLAKKATIMYLNGDLVLANDVASKYLGIKRVAREEVNEGVVA